MRSLYIFVARFILGMVFGILLTRIFLPEWSVFHGIAIGIGLVAAAHLMQMIRNRNKTD